SLRGSIGRSARRSIAPRHDRRPRGSKGRTGPSACPPTSPSESGSGELGPPGLRPVACSGVGAAQEAALPAWLVLAAGLHERAPEGHGPVGLRRVAPAAALK